MSEARMAQCSPSPSEPANKAVLRLRASGQMARSTTCVDLDAAIVEEHRQTRLLRERMADGLDDGALLRDGRELRLEPRPEGLDDRPGPILPRGAPRLGIAAADVGLDGVELSDPYQRCGGDRRIAALGDLEEAAAHMRPAESELHVAGVGQRPIAGKAISLKEAQVLIERWRQLYNTTRPHSALGYLPPAPATVVPGTADPASAIQGLRPDRPFSSSARLD